MRGIEVRPVEGRRELEAFATLPWALYRNDPAWVPPLLWDLYHHLDQKKNPWFERAKAQLFVAWRNGKPVGRISAQIDEEHNRRFEEKTGFFGFFESENDPAVATALLDTASSWCRAKGIWSRRTGSRRRWTSMPGTSTPRSRRRNSAFRSATPLRRRRGSRFAK